MRKNYFKDIGKYLQELQEIDKIFQSWDYKPTLIPLVDNYDLYKNLSSAQVTQSYRFLDPNNELLLLRSDSTVFLARMISKHLDTNSLPLRLCYSNNAIRPSKLLKDNEIQQNGVELIGVPSIAGDFEIILLISIALGAVAPQEFRIHIGSHAILDTALHCINPNITHDEKKMIIQYCRERDFVNIAKHTHKDFAHLILSIMSIEEFRERAQSIAGWLGDNTQSLFQYHTLIEGLSHIVDSDYIRCDLSELGDHDYYTNIVFSAYANNLGAAVARGGRYDTLMEYFNTKVPAVGATLFPNDLMPYLLAKEADTTPFSTSTSNAFNALSDVDEPSVKDLLKCAQLQLGDR